MKKEESAPAKATPASAPIAPTPEVQPIGQGSALPVVSAVLGIISLTGPGLFFGIPAIITGGIALKKNYRDRGLSLTGLITGIISTAISLLVVLFFIFIFIWAANNPQEFEKQYPRDTPGSHKMRDAFDSNRT